MKAFFGSKAGAFHHVVNTSLFLGSLASALVLDCEGPIPPSIDPRILAFGSLTNLCTGYPYGLGFICDGNGEVRINIPFGSVWMGPPDPTYLTVACQTHCHCADIAPDTPSIAVGPQEGQVDAVLLANVVNMDEMQLPQRDHSCSDWYGSPSQHDCANIMTIMDNELAAAGVDVVGLTHFAGSAVPSPPAGSTILPKVYSFESCFVAFYFDSDSQSTNERWERPQVDFLDIVDDCVTTQSKGGLAPATPDNPINVVVYGANSNEKKFRDQKIFSKIDSSGDAICGSMDSTGYSSDSVQNSYSSSGQSSTGSNCYRASDCASQQNSICAYDGDVDKPLDPSWGKFKCISMGHVGYAVAAALSWSNCYSGRCLLEADGSLFISQATGNATAKLVNGTSATLDRYLQLHPNSQTWKSVNQSLAGPIKPKASSSAGGANQGTTSPNTTFPTLVEPHVCPCNCTYVSRSCCLTPIVFEDVTPGGKNSSHHTIVRGPEGKCCDRDTGTFQDTSLPEYGNATDKYGACVESS